ncbi:hypothetical protein B484DRAFT_16257 [Ochromonadaceae sp. CCMP2298]|nr:hypothetical protein B484DRAFT_16257 [Ochromonadaceae sp. CCMP2298]
MTFLALTLAIQLCLSFRLVSSFQPSMMKHNVFAKSGARGSARSNLALYFSRAMEEEEESKELWRSISNYELQAVALVQEAGADNLGMAYKLFAMAASLRASDSFFQIAVQFAAAEESGDVLETERLLELLKAAGPPPHLVALVEVERLELERAAAKAAALGGAVVLVEETSPVFSEEFPEQADPGSAFSDTVTEKIRVKVKGLVGMVRIDMFNPFLYGTNMFQPLS